MALVVFLQEDEDIPSVYRGLYSLSFFLMSPHLIFGLLTFTIHCLKSILSYKFIFNNGATVCAIVNDRLSALNLELAITPNMSHDGLANVVTLSNIHGRFLFISRFHLYKNPKASIGTP